jgi:anti-anti-sigma factor
VAISSQPSVDGYQPSGTRPAHFAVQDSVCRGRHTLVLSGELDLSNADTLQTLIQRLAAEEVGGITLDLGHVDFMDSTGLRAVLVGQEICRRQGCAFDISPCSSAVRRLFELSGTIHVLKVAP